MTKQIFIALLIGKWSETCEDIKIIKKISGISYDAFIESLNPYINISIPFIIRKNNYGTVIYELAETELSWAYMYEKIPSKLIDNFVILAEEIITEKDPLFDRPFDEHFHAHITSQKPKYSYDIKQGIIRSLIFIAINGNQLKIDKCIENILSKVNSLSDWGYISQFFEELSEASPKVIVKRLESEIKDNTGLLDMFTVESKNSFTGKHYYTHILCTVEKLLNCKEYAYRVAYWLIDLGNIINECTTGNKPRDIISDIFCTWYNVSIFSAKDKISIAKDRINKYTYIWNIIYNQLPKNHTHMIINDSKFDYRLSDEKIDVTNNDFIMLNNQYFELLIQHIGDNIDRWIKMLKVMSDVPENIFNKIIENLIKCIELMSDFEREKIKTELRKIIYKHRYFSESSWAMSESRILQVEKLCKNITFNDNTFDFLYLSLPDYDFPILNPTIMSNKTYARKENEKKVEKQLESEFLRFKDSGVSLQHYLNLIKKTDYKDLGYKIAKYYSNGKFNEEIFEIMLDVPSVSNIIINYIHFCYHIDSDFIINSVLQLVKRYENNILLTVSILEMLPITVSNISSLEEQTVEIKKEYWQRSLRFYDVEDEYIYYYLNNSQKYKLYHNLLNILYETKKYLSVDEKLSYLSAAISIINEKSVVINSNDVWLIEEIMQSIHDDVDKNYKKYYEIMKLELTLREIIKWENMKCSQFLFKTNAKFYADIIGKVLKNDSGIKPKRESLENAKRLFFLYCDAKFCPG